MLGKADRGREVVEKPGKAAIVEIDHRQAVAIDEEIGKAHIGVNEAEAILALAIGGEPLAQDPGGRLQERQVFGRKPETRPPVAP